MFYFFCYLELGNITFPELPQETILEVSVNIIKVIFHSNALCHCIFIF